MTFRQNVANYVLGFTDMRSLPSIAMQALIEGLDTPSLRILAGLPQDEHEFVIMQNFRGTLQELSIELPGKWQAAREVANVTVNEIVSSKRDVFEGTTFIKSNIVDAFLIPPNDRHNYKLIGFDKVVSIYWLIDDLNDACVEKWTDNQTNREQKKHLSEKLVEELKLWASTLMVTNTIDQTR